MDKLLNAASAGNNQRKECKFKLGNKGTWRLTKDLLVGVLDPLGFGGHEAELLIGDDYISAGEVSKSLIQFVMKYIDIIHSKFSIIDFTEYYTINDSEHTTRTIIDLDTIHTKLCEVGDYTDTFKDNWSREDHDTFTISNGYALVRKNKTKKYKEEHWVCLDRTVEVSIIKVNNNSYEGLSVIPKNATLLNNVIYTDVTIERNVIFSDEYMHELKIAGNVVINSETPIQCSGGVVTIKGIEGSKLTLKSGEQQPCIGPWTRTGMSYGRWSPEGTSPKEIIIDNCTVICESKVDSFSLGCYGTNDIPKITLLNGGKLICPETSGNRVILKQAVPPGGSTKISEPMIYGIMKKEDSIFDVVPAEVRTAFAELVYKYIEYKDSLYTTTTVKDIEEAFNILSTNPNVDITLLLKSNAKLFIKRCALLLRIPDAEDIVKLDEFRFDAIKKSDFINKLVYGVEEGDQLESSVNLIHFLKINTYSTPHWNFIKEVCYEIIPSYLYDYGEHRGYTNEEHVGAFIEENKHLIHDKYKAMISRDVIDYFLWNKHII